MPAFFFSDNTQNKISRAKNEKKNYRIARIKSSLTSLEMFVFYLPEFDVAAAVAAAIVVAAVVVVLCCWRAPISKRRCRQRWRSRFAFDVDVAVDVV